MYFRVFVVGYGLKENSWKAQFKIKYWFSCCQRKFSPGNSIAEKDEGTKTALPLMSYMAFGTLGSNFR